MSGDERMKQVLGYSDKQSFEETSVPLALRDLLSHYSKQYIFLTGIDHMETVNSYLPTIDVAPILQTSWGQGFPYNDLCPEKCPSGCVATAMSQIMNYYKYPDRGKGIYSYTSYTNGFKCSYNFEKQYLNWNDILDDYEGASYTKDNISAIANLTYACGVAVGMDYTSDGSGAYDFDVPYALMNFFGYNDNVADYYRPYFKDSEWYEVIYSELQEKRPILYCGVDRKANGGHAFIIDGCKSDGKFHINWGWDGDYNGYYEIDALNPGRYAFTSQHSMVIRFCPELTGKHEDTFYASSFFKQNNTTSLNSTSSKDYKYRLSDPVCLSGSTSYAVGTSMDVRFCIGLYDEDLSFIGLLDSSSVIRCSSQQYLQDQLLSFSKNDLPKEAGQYYVAPLVQDARNRHLTRVRTLGGKNDFVGLIIEEDGSNDYDVPCDEDSVVVFYEDFENKTIPSYWQQEKEKGTIYWTIRNVSRSMATIDAPIAANGFSYVSLGNTNTNVISDIKTMTRIYTNVILSKDKEYLLTFYCRHFAKNKDVSDFLNIQTRSPRSRQWDLLNTVSIDSEYEWIKIEIPIKHSDIIMLAFEGEVNKGNALFLDYIEIKIVDETNTVPFVTRYKEQSNNNYYSVGGFSSNSKLESLNEGIYIINGQKVLIKK